MPHRPNNLINTKNCYRTIDGFVRRKKNIIKTVLQWGEEIGRKKKRDRQREKFVGREEARGGDSEGVRKEKKQRKEKK